MKKLIISLAILIPLLMTACEEAEKKVPIKPDYDFRDEQYQDFYSRFKRQREEDCKTDCLASYFDAEDIEKALNIKNVPNNAVGFVSISRIPLEEDTIIRTTNYFQTKQDILDSYKEKENNIIKSCKKENEVINLFCLDGYSDNKYFYLPQEEGYVKYIDRSIKFSCTLISYPMEKRSCTLFNFPNQPFNLQIGIKFTDPNNFFYIIPYVEKLIFNSAGEHVWQTSPQAKAS